MLAPWEFLLELSQRCHNGTVQPSVPAGPAAPTAATRVCSGLLAVGTPIRHVTFLYGS